MVSLLGVAVLFGGGVTTAFQFGRTVEQKFLSTTISPTPTTKSGSLIPTSLPAPVIVSKTGIIQATYQNPPSPTTEPLSNQATDSGQARMTITPRPVLHYILVSRSGSIIFLSSTDINFANYLSLRVLITGAFDSTKNTLTISKPTDIEVLQ